MKPGPPPYDPDPVIDAYKPGVDMTLIRENLKLTQRERLRRLQSALRSVEAVKKQRLTFKPSEQGR